MLVTLIDKAKTILKVGWNFVKPRRKAGWVCFAVVAALAISTWLVLGQTAQAQSATGLPDIGVSSFFISAITSILMTVAIFFIKITIFILKFVIELGGYNGYIDSQAVTVGWVMVRDVTNMFFVIILLLVAFGTILGIEQYEWKKLLVKLLFAAILVNFSRTICGVIIDISQVVMITFINGVAATAGGNLINAFKLQDMLSFGPAVQPTQISSSNTNAAAIAAVIFSGMAMVTVGVYVVILLARMIVLWILIVLSPLAFVLNVIPQTQKYASQWWTEFGNHVVVGPILAFFLWLSFVVVGTGTVHDEVRDASAVPDSSKISDAGSAQVQAEADEAGQVGVLATMQNTAGITSVTSWANMANFAIAIGMLLVGAKVTQSLGVTGGAMMGKVTDFGKKVAAVATGYTAARWAVKKTGAGLKAAGMGIGKGLYDVLPRRYVKMAKNLAWRSTIGAWKSWGSEGPKIKRTEIAEGEKLTESEQAAGMWIKQDDKTGKWYKYGHDRERVKDKKTGEDAELREGEDLDEEEKRKGYTIEESGGKRYKVKKVDTRGAFQQFIYAGRQMEMKSDKKVKRLEADTEIANKLIDKRISADPAHWMKVFLGNKDEYRFGARDRMRQGELEAEEERSTVKTGEFKAYTRRLGKANPRFKNGKWENKRPTISEQIQAHKALQEMAEAQEQAGAMKNRAAFLERYGHVMDSINEAELGKKTAEEIVNQIKQAKLATVFKEGAEQLKDAFERLKSGETYENVLGGITNVGARASFAEFQSNYLKENLTETARLQAMDEAERLYKFERSGQETPPSAFKRLVKKREEVLEGTEKEKAASMVTDTVKRLGTLRETRQLDVDQEAEFMSAIKFLVKNGWSDDFLARAINVVKEYRTGKYQGNERATNEGRFMQDMIINQLHWGEIRDGELQIVNESSEKRTNDMHRLMGFAGDTNMLHSENAVLLHQQAMKKKKTGSVDLNYTEAAKDLAAQLRTGGVGADVQTAMSEIGRELGWGAERIGQQLNSFNETFVRGATDAAAASGQFVNAVKKFKDQLEFLTEMKATAINTTHVDDAGHGAFDQEVGFAHGQLSNDAMSFMLTDWVKQEAGSRMRKLKSHAIGNMDEDFGTLHLWDRARLAATFEGVETKQKIEGCDTRVNRHIIKYGADEKLDKDETGALKVGAVGSKLRQRIVGEKDAMRDVARDWAAMLETAPKILLAKLASASGLTFEDGMKGKMNVNLFGRRITSAGQLIEWINKRIGAPDAVDTREIKPLEEAKILAGARARPASAAAEEEEEEEHEGGGGI